MKKWGLLLILLAGVIAAGYLLSPFARLGTRVTALMSKGNSDAVFSCNESRITLPPGLALEGFRIDFKRKQNSGIEAALLKLQPRLGALLTGRLSVLLNADAYGGGLNGDLEFIKYLTAQGPLRAKFNVSGIDLEKCAFVSAMLGAPLKGKLQCVLDYTGDSTELLNGAGRVDFAIRGAEFRAPRSMTGLVTDIKFNTLEAQIVFEQKKLKVGRLVLASDSIQSVLKGYVFLKEELGSSEVSLSGKLSLPALSKVQLDFAITGTVAKPIITVM